MFENQETMFENYLIPALSWNECNLNCIKLRVFFGKNIEKMNLSRHDKNYYYFWNSNIPVINLIAGSRNMIKLSKI